MKYLIIVFSICMFINFTFIFLFLENIKIDEKSFLVLFVITTLFTSFIFFIVVDKYFEILKEMNEKFSFFREKEKQNENLILDAKKEVAKLQTLNSVLNKRIGVL